MGNLDIMPWRSRRQIALGLLLAVLLGAVIAYDRCHAGGFMIPHQTAKGLGMANALTAGVDDPSAVYYNPAALREVDGNVLLLNGSYINVINSVENRAREARNLHDDNFLAALFVNYHLPGSNVTFGLGAYTPFGLATTYEAGFARFAAQRTELRTLYVTPAFSWSPFKQLSIGAGASFVHATGLFSRALCFDPITGCTAPIGLEGRMRITDTTHAFAYNLGILFKPVDRIKLGFSYRSRTDLRFREARVKLEGAFSIAATSAEVRPLPLPPVIDLGVFWQITPFLGAEFVYEHVRWEEFARFGATFSPRPRFLGAPVAGFSLPQEWKSTSVFRLGAFYKLTAAWEIRAGITLDETPIPERRLNPAIPGADILTLNAGVGYHVGRISVDVGYMAALYKTRRARNVELEGIPATGIPFLGVPGRDKFTTFNNFVALSLSYAF
ncbi:MAG TPA: outer membrane protein transport protein [Candidatus Eisenbacteria bacterium]|nr:outer membrane protein transport protein [Candidatus Eisenbacteria bacterium]